MMFDLGSKEKALDRCPGASMRALSTPGAGAVFVQVQRFSQLPRFPPERMTRGGFPTPTADFQPRVHPRRYEAHSQADHPNQRFLDAVVQHETHRHGTQHTHSTPVRCAKNFLINVLPLVYLTMPKHRVSVLFYLFYVKETWVRSFQCFHGRG